MSTETRPAHSPLGASGAERWMNCPGSVALLKELRLPESDEPDYRADGTAAHELIETCLRQGIDAWELMGDEFGNKRTATPEMVMAGQVYLDRIRELMQAPDAIIFIEQSIEAPEFHKDFYGTVDCGVVVPSQRTLYVNDFKFGEGIMVDVEHNPQVMYYAYGILRHHPEVERVVSAIVQPRGFHPNGQVRVWETSAAHINSWAENELHPAMLRTEFDHSLDAGPWCRFCPAKLVCPMMIALFGAACKADPRVTHNLSNESLGRSYQYVAAVKSYLKALEEETLRRANLGQTVPGTKMVYKKANRVFKSGAKEALEAVIPAADLYTKPELKSPAEVEKIGAAEKKLVHEWAYTPQTGLTIALESDKRVAVKVQSTDEAFPGAAALAAMSASSDA